MLSIRQEGGKSMNGLLKEGGFWAKRKIWDMGSCSEREDSKRAAGLIQKSTSQ